MTADVVLAHLVEMKARGGASARAAQAVVDVARAELGDSNTIVPWNTPPKRKAGASDTRKAKVAKYDAKSDAASAAKPLRVSARVADAEQKKAAEAAKRVAEAKSHAEDVQCILHHDVRDVEEMLSRECDWDQRLDSKLARIQGSGGFRAVDLPKYIALIEKLDKVDENMPIELRVHRMARLCREIANEKRQSTATAK